MDIGVSYKELFKYEPDLLARLLADADDEIWLKNDFRQKAFAVHKNTKSIVYVWSNFSDVNYQLVETHIPDNNPDPIHQEVWKVAHKIRDCYGTGARITKLMLAKLDKRSEIMPHTDNGNLREIHRCHLPVITTDECVFFINNEPHTFKPTFAFEFNNQRMHGVKNNSDHDRVHLICDVLD